MHARTLPAHCSFRPGVYAHRPFAVRATPGEAPPPDGGDISSTSAGARPSTSDLAGPDLGLGLKAAWYAAEAAGNAVGAAKAATGKETAAAATPASSTSPLAWADAVDAIRADYEQVYFVSGRGDLAAYAPDCYFADPFAGFTGTDRFVRNVSNLGSTLSDVKLSLTSFEADEAARTVRTAWKFSGVVNALPWRPRLAAAGSTTHTVDQDSGRVVRHIEAWSSSPGQVVAALIRPAAEVPGNRWERGAAALAAGDVRGAAAAGLKVLALAAFHGAGWAAVGRLVGGGGAGGVGGGEAFLWGAGAVMAGLDLLTSILGTGGTGRPVKRK